MVLILCLNAGSSSLKAAAYAVDPGGGPRLVGRVLVEDIGGDRGRVVVRGAGGDVEGDHLGPVPDHAAAWRSVQDATIAWGTPDVIVHRIVHGGPSVTDHAVVTPEVRAALGAATALAPLHQPPALAVLDAATAQHPDRPQVACLDTAFHRTLPVEAHHYPLPEVWAGEPSGEIRRYGFHGLNYEHVVATVGAGRLGRAVIAHLGNGASLCAVVDGISVDTTMGLTPTGGLVMGTRPGDLDPGIVIYLARALGDVDAVEDLLDRRSGLQGLSGGVTHDVRSLVEARDGGDRRAARALALFTRSAAKGIGALATVTGGLDTVVFTGGIGEHAAAVRAEIVDRLTHLGVALDPARNVDPWSATSATSGGPGAAPAGAATAISPDGSPVSALVVPADEEIVMARHACRLLA